MPDYTPTTLDQARALINSYLVDNKSNDVSVSRLRALMQVTLDYMATTMGDGGGGVDLNLQSVTTGTNNNKTTNPLIVTSGVNASTMNAFNYFATLNSLNLLIAGIQAGAPKISFADSSLDGTKYIRLSVDGSTPVAEPAIDITMSAKRSGRIFIEGDNNPPTLMAGYKLGVGGSASFVTGVRSDDRGGAFDLTTGPSLVGLSGTVVFLMDFAKAYDRKQKVLLMPANENANSLGPQSQVHAWSDGISNGGFIGYNAVASNLQPNTTYRYQYFIYS